MDNPLQLLRFRTREVAPRARTEVPVPTAIDGTDAVFVVLRRMRRPLLVVLTTFSIATGGMMLMPGTDADGNPYRHTLLDAFYQMTMTVTTVGYTEAPYAFSYAQRMWVALAIFCLVVSWAYAIGSLFAALQDPAFTDALSTQRFRRQVRRLGEPFFVIAGYGHAGRTVGRELDALRRRFVVVDREQSQVDRAVTDPLHADVPGMEGNCADPAVLGLAGLANPTCRGVLALTDDDESNLAVVMTVSLLSTDVPVYARCSDRRIADRMEDFGPEALINPNERYGGYLALAAYRPAIHQLLIWLMENEHHRLGPEHPGMAAGRWVVCGEGQFVDHVAEDLRASGLHVDVIADDSDLAAVDGAVAFVAGTDNDMDNIALAEAARQINPEIFLAVRQVDSMHRPLLAALEVDSVFIATELVAREVLARIVHPYFWRFIEETVQRDDEWARSLRDRLVAHCGRAVPERDVISLDATSAPAIVRWLEHDELRLGDLKRDAYEREDALPVEALLLVRREETIVTPPDDTLLRVGDQLLFAGTSQGLADLSEAMYSSVSLTYVVTGEVVPRTWIWRVLTGRRLPVEA